MQLEQLDNEVRSKAKQQKAKVLDALWKMDIDSRKKVEEEIKENKVSKIQGKSKRMAPL